MASTSRVEDALEELERLGGWRAFLLLPPEAADAEAIVEALPWVEQGAPRPGTAVRIFKLQGGLVVATGGHLSDEEGAHLFGVHEQLKDIVARESPGSRYLAYIIPPQSAAPALVARMYEAGLAPSLPTGKLPNPRGWAGLGGVLLLGGSVMARALRRTTPADSTGFRLVLLGLLALVAICGVLYWVQNRKLQDILSDPVRVAATRWAPNLPRLVGR